MAYRCVLCLPLSYLITLPPLPVYLSHTVLLSFPETHQVHSHSGGFVLTSASVWNTCHWFQLNCNLYWQAFHSTPVTHPPVLFSPWYLSLFDVFCQSLSNQNVSFRRAGAFPWSPLFLNHLKWYLVHKRDSCVFWWVHDLVCQSKPNIPYLKGDIYIKHS